MLRFCLYLYLLRHFSSLVYTLSHILLILIHNVHFFHKTKMCMFYSMSSVSFLNFLCYNNVKDKKGGIYMSSILLQSNYVPSGTFISNLFIDKYMPAANGAYVKVYLYLLGCMGNNSVKEIE